MIKLVKQNKNSVLEKVKNGQLDKLSTIRGIVGDVGIIEDIRFSGIKTHDLALSEDMLRTSPVLKFGDILINDRGFLSRDILNFLKTNRGVDTYIPLRKNMGGVLKSRITTPFHISGKKWSFRLP